MTPGSQAGIVTQRRGERQQVTELRIGVVLEAFLDWSLEQTMAGLQAEALEITDLEIGAGGYVPHPHCDVRTLLTRHHAVPVDHRLLPPRRPGR